MLNILYEDSHIIVVWKPVGMESQSARGFGADMVSEIKRHIHKLSPKGGEPYVGVIHRLDKPVSGVMVYAKDKKSAATLSKQVSDHWMTKKYLAVLCGKPVDNVDNFVDYLLKDEKENCSRIVDKGITGAKCAELTLRALESVDTDDYGTLTLAEIALKTGRHHQIRVQMAGHGMPVWGDRKYNPMFGGEISAGGSAVSCKNARDAGKAGDAENVGRAGNVGGMPVGGLTGGRRPRVDVALASWQLSFVHPVSGEKMSFQHLPEGAIFRKFPFCAEK